jgi:hypothetical protein
VRTQRSVDKLRHMLEREPTHRLKTIVGDYTTAAGAHTLVSWLNTRAQSGLNHVVSIHGGRHASAKLTDVKGGDFKETMHGVRRASAQTTASHSAQLCPAPDWHRTRALAESAAAHHRGAGVPLAPAGQRGVQL